MTKAVTTEDVGLWVRFWDEGWRFGELVEIGPSKGLVKHPVHGNHWHELKNIETLRLPA